MKQPDKSKQSDVNKKTIKDNGNMDQPEMQPEKINYENGQDDEVINPEALAITEEITELLSKENIITEVQKFKADSEEKEIAVEFANSHIQFLKQIIESDSKKGITRTDPEIRDLLSHVNAMLKKKNEYLFTTMVMHSPSHYKSIQKNITRK